MKKENDKAAFLGRMTASVTHEIQNVLAIVKETSGLMEDFLLMNQKGELPDFEEKVDKCIKTIKKQAYRGVTLTSGLNGFAHTPDRLERSINVHELIRKIIAIAGRLFEQKGFSVLVNDCDRPCTVTTDPVLFQMLVVSCVDCFTAYVDPATPIIVDIHALDSSSAISFSYDTSTISHQAVKEKIRSSPLWEQTCDLCKQIGFTAEIMADPSRILISFR